MSALDKATMLIMVIGGVLLIGAFIGTAVVLATL